MKRNSKSLGTFPRNDIDIRWDKRRAVEVSESNVGQLSLSQEVVAIVVAYASNYYVWVTVPVGSLNGGNDVHPPGSSIVQGVHYHYLQNEQEIVFSFHLLLPSSILVLRMNWNKFEGQAIRRNTATPIPNEAQ